MNTISLVLRILEVNKTGVEFDCGHYVVFDHSVTPKALTYKSGDRLRCPLCFHFEDVVDWYDMEVGDWYDFALRSSIPGLPVQNLLACLVERLEGGLFATVEDQCGNRYGLKKFEVATITRRD
jgi:hypothetical protein